MSNPYAPPEAKVADDVHIDPAIVELRQKHLAHEASVRSAGMLFYLAGALTALSGIVAVGALLEREPDLTGIGTSALFLSLGVAELVVGFGLRKLDRKARVGAGIISAVALIAFPIGTLLGAYILYLLFARKGRMVFSREYAHARELTPHMKYRASVIVLMGGVLLLAFFVLALVSSIGGMPD